MGPRVAFPAYRPDPIPVPTFYTEHLVLRPPRLRDVLRIWRGLRDPEMRQFVRNVPRYTPLHAVRFVVKAARDRRRGRRVDYLIFHRETGELVGCRSIFGLRQGPPRAGEVGAWITKPFWGSRLASATGVFILPFYFQTLGLHRLTSIVNEQNTQALKLIDREARSGGRAWHSEGMLRDHVWRGGAFGNFYLYSLLRSDPSVIEIMRAAGLEPEAESGRGP